MAAAGRHHGGLQRLPPGRGPLGAGRLAGYGYDASHHGHYWAVKLYLLVCPDGMPLSWWTATPELGARQVAVELLGQAAELGILRPGMVALADKGLAGRDFEGSVGALGARLVRPDRRDEPTRFGDLGGVRQWVEAIIDTLKDQLGLEQHRARTPRGLWVRIAQRLLALAACI